MNLAFAFFEFFFADLIIGFIHIDIIRMLFCLFLQFLTDLKFHSERNVFYKSWFFTN